MSIRIIPDHGAGYRVQIRGQHFVTRSALLPKAEALHLAAACLDDYRKRTPDMEAALIDETVERDEERRRKDE